MYSKLNLNEKAVTQYNKIISHEQKYGVSYPLNLAILYGNFGEIEKMNKYLDQSYNIKSPNLAVLKLPYDLDFFKTNLFDNEHYIKLIKKMNLPIK
jgi:hypothetical protein